MMHAEWREKCEEAGRALNREVVQTLAPRWGQVGLNMAWPKGPRYVLNVGGLTAQQVREVAEFVAAFPKGDE